MSDREQKKGPRGCSFLVHEVGFEPISSPETLNDAGREIAGRAADFMAREVFGRAEDAASCTPAKTIALLERAGAAGFLGGEGLSQTHRLLVGEQFGQCASFSSVVETQLTRGILALAHFGTPAQRQAWLEKLGRAEAAAAWALTEADSGSDALAARTTATQTADGRHFEITGTKTWVTNADSADLFIVFCQINATKFSALLVEAERAGVRVQPAIQTMGRRGAAVCDVEFDRVRVPVEHVLGEVGKGHRLVAHVLNMERFKLGANSLGLSKRALQIAVRYALGRKQFGQSIAEFGAIRAKLGRMATRIWTLEAMCYRVAGYLDTDEAIGAMEEFAVEAAILKVFGAEAAVFVSDEAVQIHGGRGYSAGCEAERIYRDARLGPLDAGTNEITRMLIPSMILKRTMKGELNLFEMIAWVETSFAADLAAGPGAKRSSSDTTLQFEVSVVEAAKKLVVHTIHQAIQKHMADLREQQEILMDLADMLIALFAMDSSVVRCRQRAQTGADAGFARAATRLQVSQSARQIRHLATRLLNHLSVPTTALDLLDGAASIDEIALERAAARAVVSSEGFPG